MERAVAVKKLSKLLAKGWSYEINPKAPTAEEREAARAQAKSLAETVTVAANMMRDRREMLLKNDPEYQRLLAEYRAATKAKDKNSGSLHSYKFTVGHVDNLGGFGVFHVKAQGDSWEDVIAKLTNEH